VTEDLTAELATALVATTGASEALQTIATACVRGLADWCIADLLSDPDLVTRVAAVSRTGPLDLPAENGRLDARRSSAGAGGLLAALATAPQPALRFDADRLSLLTQHEDWRTRTQAQLLVSLGTVDVLVLGLRARGTMLGVLVVGRTAEAFSDADVVTLQGVAALAALTLDNVRLLVSQRSFSTAMQTSLLPPLPIHLGIGLAARYHPATAGLEVGGDWYDAFTLPSGSLALVIGDVTGHDADAAAKMAELRNLLRAVACHTGDSPQSTLASLEELTRRLRVEAGATCLLANVDPPVDGGRRLRWSSAGHLPPLLLRDSETRYLDTAADLMLGVQHGSSRTGHDATLQVGDVVVLYSDGLVEDRRTHLDDRLALLASAARSAPDRTPDFLADWLLREMAAGGADDVALLVVRIES
jgi:hypothetical protein